MTTRQQVVDLCSRYPELSPREAAERLGTTPEYVRAMLSREKLSRSRPKGLPGAQSTWTEADTERLMYLRGVKKLRWDEVAKELSRPTSTCMYQYKRQIDATIADKRDPVDRVRDIPPDVLIDAQRRNLAPRTITAFMMGDPAPGQSALDKRQGAHA